jgi:hypothetical protein
MDLNKSIQLLKKVFYGIEHPENNELAIIYNKHRRWGIQARNDDETIYAETLPLALRLCDFKDEADALEYFCKEAIKVEFEPQFPNDEEW